MSRADKIAKRQADRLCWLKLHAQACVVCGTRPQGDDGEYSHWLDPSMPEQVYVCEQHMFDDDAIYQAARELADLEAP
jgi:hypothetical protein